MQTIVDLRARIQAFTAFWVVAFFLICGAMIVLTFILSFRKRARDAKVEEEMNPNHFVMWLSRGDSWGFVVVMLVWGVASFFLFFLDFDLGTEVMFISVIGFFATFYYVLQGISWKFWELRIEGNQIHYKSLFRRKTFSFHDIKEVRGKYYHGGESRELDQIKLYSETGKMFSVDVMSIGYRIFVKRLEQRGIDVKALDLSMGEPEGG